MAHHVRHRAVIRTRVDAAVTAETCMLLVSRHFDDHRGTRLSMWTNAGSLAVVALAFGSVLSGVNLRRSEHASANVKLRIRLCGRFWLLSGDAKTCLFARNARLRFCQRPSVKHVSETSTYRADVVCSNNRKASAPRYVVSVGTTCAARCILAGCSPAPARPRLRRAAPNAQRPGKGRNIGEWAQNRDFPGRTHAWRSAVNAFSASTAALHPAARSHRIAFSSASRRCTFFWSVCEQSGDVGLAHSVHDHGKP